MEAARAFIKRGGELRLRIHAGGRLDFQELPEGRAFRAASVFKLIRTRAAAGVSRETACGRFTDLIVRGR